MSLPLQDTQVATKGKQSEQAQHTFPNHSSCNIAPSPLMKILENIKDLLTRNSVHDQDSQDAIWSTYLTEATKHDSELMERYKSDTDIVILFSTLFTAVVAAFVVAMQPALSPNSNDTTNQLLKILIHTIDNSTQLPTIPQWNGPADTTIWSIILGCLSLSLGLFAAFGSVMGRQWLSHFSRLDEGTVEERGRRRQQKLDALRTWRFDVVIAILPTLLHAALVLFLISLSLGLWETSQAAARVLVCVTILGGLVYMALTALSLWIPSCPYETLLTTPSRWMIITAIDIARELASHLRLLRSETTTYPLWRLLALLFLPVFGWGAICLAILLLVLLAAVPLFMSLKSGLHDIASQRVSLSKKLSSFKNNTLSAHRDQQYPEFHLISHILARSVDYGVIMAAVKRIPERLELEVHELEKDHEGEEPTYDFLPLTKHLFDRFVDSIGAMNRRHSAHQQDYTIALGKALVAILCNNLVASAVDPPFWNGARTKLSDLQAQASSTGSDPTIYLWLVILLLPSQDGVQFDVPLRITQVPEPSLFWSLPYLRTALQRRPNLNITDLISAFPEHVCLLDVPRQSTSEQSSYFRACHAYLRLLTENASYKTAAPRGGEGSAAARVRGFRVSNVNWKKVLCQILDNLHDATADTSPFLLKEGCIPHTLKEIRSALQTIYRTSWPDEIRTSVHKLAFVVYSSASNQPTRVPRQLMINTIELAATDPCHEEALQFYNDTNGQMLVLLLRYLVLKDAATEVSDWSIYLLCLFKASSAPATKLLWLNVDVVDYLLHDTRHNRAQQISLEILLATCEPSGVDLDELMALLIPRQDFHLYIYRAIASPMADPHRRTTGLRFLSTIRAYLPRFPEEMRKKWRDWLGRDFHTRVKRSDLTPDDQSLLDELTRILTPGN